MIDVPIYLASKSPRRRKLLKLIYPNIHLLNIDTPEEFIAGETPVKTVQRIARQKMHAALPQAHNGIIITADTIVVLDGELLGKPLDESDAWAMLRKLAGRTHTVYTGFCIHFKPYHKELTGYERTNVTFREMTDDEIRTYVAAGSPMDKAGAYGIQDDYGAVFVKKISGCYYNVVGLPLSKVHTYIERVKQSVSAD